MPTISVVIPVLDDAPMLRLCLGSLAVQTRRADEVVVVDNGSRDDSARIAAEAGARVIAEHRPGVTAAAARGFDAAHGEIIARCDADCRLPADWLERIERVFAERPEIMALTGPGSFYDLRGLPRRFGEALYMRGYFLSMHAALGNSVLFGSNYAIRSAAWRRVSTTIPRDDPAIHDDIDLSYRLNPAEIILYDPRLVVGISARPLRSGRGILRRIGRAFHTFSIHWPEQSPPRRWQRRAMASSPHRHWPRAHYPPPMQPPSLDG